MKKSYWYIIGVSLFVILAIVFIVFRKSFFHSSTGKGDITVNQPVANTNDPDRYRATLTAIFKYQDSTGMFSSTNNTAFLKTYDSLTHLTGLNEATKKDKCRTLLIDAATSFLFQMAYGKDIGLSYSGVKYNIDSSRIINMANHLAEDGNWQKAIDSIEPQEKQYQLLKDEFIRMHAFVQSNAQIDSVDTTSLLAIRNNTILKLKAYGFINQSIANQSIGDESLSSAIRGFQKMVDIDTTGSLDKITLTNLQITLHSRLNEIKRSLNFRRWVKRLPERKFVLVNVATAQLRIIDTSSDKIQMRVIVGRPKDQTPLFAAYINKITTYPQWVVPLSIETKEMLPLIQKSISYLKKNNLEVVDQKGNILNPAQINWQQYSRKNFPFIIRQETGCDDALGIVKFSLNYPYDIYMHDTDNRDLFKQKNRVLSHGCIRLESPLTLAKYLLEDDFDSADAEYLNQCMKNQKPKDIIIKKKIPVVIYYMTADISESGTLKFHKDVYGLENY